MTIKIEDIRKDGLYTYVASNYWKMSKEDLKNIALELICAIDSEDLEEALESIEEVFTEEE